MTESQTLDRVFLALGHPVRRRILRRLVQGPATVTAIAEPYQMSLNAVSKHVKILERANLIQREIIGREHYCSFRPGSLKSVSKWLDYYQTFWTTRFDALEQEIIAKKRSKGPAGE